jgi:hypothetical protein
MEAFEVYREVVSIVMVTRCMGVSRIELGMMIY